VIRRRPEIKWRIQPEQLPVLAARQRAILEDAAAAVRPGGLLVFSVCTLEPDEGPAAFAGFLEAHPEFDPEPIGGSGFGPGGGAIVAPAPQGSGDAFLYPHLHGTDGFFVAACRRQP
jgi:16S rRNA (cytosine967-C5)-methyltransferase